MKTNERETIEREILTKLYDAWELDNRNTILTSLCEEQGWAQKDFDTVLEELEYEQGLIAAVGSWSAYNITADGVIRAEEKALISEDRIAAHNAARRRVLDFVLDVYNREGVAGAAFHDDLVNNGPLGRFEMGREVELLRNLGYIKDESTNTFSITALGRNA